MSNVIPLFDPKLQRTLNARQFHPSSPEFGRMRDAPDATETRPQAPESDEHGAHGCGCPHA